MPVHFYVEIWQPCWYMLPASKVLALPWLNSKTVQPQMVTHPITDHAQYTVKEA